ncbi:MAG: hypothetical protein ACOZE5_11310 [Verrucomicrobiota bacterium]
MSPPAALAEAARGMRKRVEAAGREGIGAMVCERLAGSAPGSLPTEGFFSLTRGPAGWTLLAGFGGMAADPPSAACGISLRVARAGPDRPRGVSSKPGGIGNTIPENLRRAGPPRAGLPILKPGQTAWLGLPCVPDVAALRDASVDLLILALPAPARAIAAQVLAGCTPPAPAAMSPNR